MSVEVFWEVLPPDAPAFTFTVSLGSEESFTGQTLDGALELCRNALSGDTLSAGIAREV